MSPQTLTNRVEILERKVEGLAELPDRVGALELQVSQLRTEMRGEFSAVRTEMRELNEETRHELGRRIDELGTHMRVLHEDVISRIALLDEHTNGPRSARRSSPRQARKERKLKD